MRKRAQQQDPAAGGALRWVGAGIGAFTGNPLPQDPVVQRTREYFAAQKGPPGIRLAQSNNPSGRYFGTNIVPRVVLRGEGPRANRPVDLELAAMEGNPGPFLGGAPSA